jgi:anti-sigma regulatory factor (Ser/Thr protein kinase)
MTVRHEHLELPFAPEAVRRARSFVRECAPGMSPGAIANAELLVSEIVTNAVLHGAPDLGVTVAVEHGEMTVRVADGDSRVPTRRDQARADATSGRGLRLVEALSVAWGVEVAPAGRGKTVWFRVTEPRTQATRVLGSER